MTKEKKATEVTVSSIFLKKQYGRYWKWVLTDFDRVGRLSYKFKNPLPTPEDYKQLQDIKFRVTLSDAFSQVQSEVESLKEDLDNWRDGMTDPQEALSKSQ